MQPRGRASSRKFVDPRRSHVGKSEQARAIRGAEYLSGLALQRIGAPHEALEVGQRAHGGEPWVADERGRRMESAGNRSFEQAERSVVIARLRQDAGPIIKDLGVAET